MDVNNVAALSSNLVQTRQNQAVGIALLKKTMEIQGKTVTSLLDAVSRTPPYRFNPITLARTLIRRLDA